MWLVFKWFGTRSLKVSNTKYTPTGEEIVVGLYRTKWLWDVGEALMILVDDAPNKYFIQNLLQKFSKLLKKKYMVLIYLQHIT